ncbi:internal virion protein [Pseudomonas phage Eisa9]|uniref:Internal virion protein n=1 Tax=Pseudomonas phage Eisa9 TaxID=2900148 RepID=A0AAE8YJ18_9CAUD|nr:internal virion protein [Pseudomonas phage Eisa9]
MFFAMAGQAVLGAIKTQNEAKTTNLVNKTNTYIANLNRQVSNERSVAVAALNNMTQSISNNDMLRNGGRQVEKLNNQYVELGKQMTSGGLQQRLSAASQTGALVAAAGASGVGGGSVNALNNTLNLTATVGESEMEKTYNNQIFAIDDAQRETTYQMYNTINSNLYQANIQVADIIGPAKVDDSWQTAALSAGASLLGNMYQTGMFSKGGSLDISSSSGGISGLLSRSFGGGGSTSTTGSNFALGAKLL